MLELKELNSINRWEMMRYDGSAISVSLRSRFDALPAHHTVTLTVGTRYFYTRSQMRHNLLDFSIKVVFDIEPFASLAGDSEGEIEIPPRLMTLMYGVAIGALRGMLAQKLEGTVLRDYPLPLVNISELVSRHIYGTPTPEHTVPLVDFRYN